ncbi:MAG: hypothetical protein R2729_24010 [Bryobacteraceae bacterium]
MRRRVLWTATGGLGLALWLANGGNVPDAGDGGEEAFLGEVLKAAEAIDRGQVVIAGEDEECPVAEVELADGESKPADRGGVKGGLGAVEGSDVLEGGRERRVRLGGEREGQRAALAGTGFQFGAHGRDGGTNGVVARKPDRGCGFDGGAYEVWRAGNV